MTQFTNLQIDTCPFLGIRGDTTSHMAFTSPENTCHQCKPFAQIKLDHQNDYCLDANFINCPIYLNGAGKRMPADLVYDEREDRQSAPADRRILWAGLILTGIFAAIAIFYLISSKNRVDNPPVNSIGINAASSLTAIAISPSNTSTNTPFLAASPIGSPDLSTALPLLTATVTPFPTLTLTLPASSVPSATFTATKIIPKTTPTQIPPHSLEVPIGGNGQLYLIHKIVNGENLSTLTETYQTSLEAILAVNSTLVVPIRLDALVIIPLNNKEANGLPKLEVYQITQNQITVEALADQLKMDLALFKSVNNLEDGEKLNQGSWVLIPR
jgi:hypothetical protein